MTKLLTEIEYQKTFGNRMIDVTTTAESVVDIWNYVEELVQEGLIHKHVYENNLVEAVYRNGTSTFDHILLPVDSQNLFIALVVDLKNEIIFGHFKLNLNQAYGHNWQMGNIL